MAKERKSRLGADDQVTSGQDGRDREGGFDGFPVSDNPDFYSGFAESEAAAAPSPAVQEPVMVLTDRQQRLRETLLASSGEDLESVFATGGYSLDDFLEVALDSLRRSNAIAERMLADSAQYRREFERLSQQIKASQRETDRKLAELLGDGR